ncbi:MAG: beta-aspartyl-peptidase [Oscillospiraceae bacterium]|jgi:beta-aspartyl-dipeptidase (metallo-type)|nr:beta-aspartyl-peptidase [Oscillospiraceae bacterium]
MLLIKNVSMGDTGRRDILAAGGKILAIEPELSCGTLPVKVIEAQGMRAIPGYLDQHVHVTGGGGEGGFSNRTPELRLSSCIKAGVTTLVGLLGTDGTTRSVENLLAKTKSLREEGLSAYCLTGAYEYPSPTITGSVKKDIMLIDEIIGVKVALSDHRSFNLSKNDMVHLASEATMGGILANKAGAVCIHMGRGKRGLGLLFDILKTEDVPITTFRPTHVGKVFDDAIRFAKMGGYIDFTAGSEEDHTADQLVKAFAAAPPDRITLSTDSNGSAPIWNEKKELCGIGIGKISTLHEVIRRLVLEYGVPLGDAVKVSTENVARALKLFPKKGTIAPGSDADLILLDDALQIDSVIAGGQVMMQGKKLFVKGNFE